MSLNFKVIISFLLMLSCVTSAMAACPTLITTAISECDTTGSPAVVISNTGSVSTTVKGAINYSGGNSGSLVNNGVINATASVANAYDFWTGTNTTTEAGGILSSELRGYVKNVGEIHSSAIGNQGNAYSSGINANGNLLGTLENIGSITAVAQSNVVGHGAVAQGIRFNGYLQNTVNQLGTISAEAKGDNAEAYGVYINGNLLGSLTTDGSMSSIASAKQGATYINGGWAAGVDTNGNLIGSLTNSSKITVSVTVESGQATGTGLRVNGDLQGSIVNKNIIDVYSGALTNNASAYGAGINIRGSLQGALRNEGAIKVNTSGNSAAYGIDISGEILAGRVLDNAGSIEAKNDGQSGAAVGLNIGYLNGTVNNSGSITAKNAVTVSYGSGALNNTGSIKGDVRLGGAITTTNTGVIDGNVDIDNGVLNLGKGSNITGKISGNSSSILNTNDEVHITNGVNVSTVNVRGGSTLHIDSANVSALSAIVDGQLINNGVFGSSTGSIHVGGGISGAGFFGAQTTVERGGHLTPGNNGADTVTFDQGLSLMDGSVIDFDLGTLSDKILVTNGAFATAQESGSINFNFIFGQGFETGTEYTLIDWTGTTGNTVDLASFYTSNSNVTFRIDGNALKVSVSSVPVPAPAWLFGSGLIGLFIGKRRIYCRNLR